MVDYSSRERQRIKDRVPCNIDVTINKSIVGRAFDASEGGLFVNTEHPFNPGSVVKVVLPLKDDKLELSARVKHWNEGVGVGLMFIDLDDFLKSRIR